MIVTVIKARELIDCNRDVTNSNEVLPGGVHVTRLNFKTSCVGVYKCLLLIVGFAVTVAIWPREVVSCRDFVLRAVATFCWNLPWQGLSNCTEAPTKKTSSYLLWKIKFLAAELPEKTAANILWCHHWSPCEMTSEKRTQKFYADDVSLPKSW